jgi:hypothetical protein
LGHLLLLRYFLLRADFSLALALLLNLAIDRGPG